MRKPFLMLASLLVVGCTTIPIAAPAEHTEVINPIQKVIEPAQKTSIFRYYTDPVTQAQAMASVEGVFKWQKGCLYLIQKDGSYMTAMFPKYPENAVKWNEYNKTLSLNGYIFKMGDYIRTNGQYSKYYPDNDIEEYAKQGDGSCLTPMLVEIGTIDLKK